MYLFGIGAGMEHHIVFVAAAAGYLCKLVLNPCSLNEFFPSAGG
jgi:hypothetical protein